MGKFIAVLSLVILAIIPLGCTPPVTYVVDVEYTPELKESVPAKTEQLQIAIIPFEDGRMEKGVIGTRRRLLGRIDKFYANPAPVSTAVTEALASALKIRGYQPEILPKGTNVEGITQSPPQIVVSGKIEKLQADAQSNLGYTDIKTTIRLQLKVYKVDQKSTYTINVQSQSEPRFVFFNPSVMQNTINNTLNDAINNLISNQWKDK